jgi:hypothetical protein
VLQTGIETVSVYVRKGLEDDERYLTFRFPEWLSQGEVLDKGWAVDGNQVLVCTTKAELQTVERDMVDWFRQKGFGITFC